eukprot:1462089-Rhodomonas_salina.1
MSTKALISSAVKGLKEYTESHLPEQPKPRSRALPAFTFSNSSVGEREPIAPTVSLLSCPIPSLTRIAPIPSVVNRLLKHHSLKMWEACLGGMAPASWGAEGGDRMPQV